MRILHVLDHFLPYQSGYTYRSSYLLREQVRLGWEPHILTAPRHAYADGDTSFDGIPVHRTAAPRGLAGPIARLPVLKELPYMGATRRRIDQLLEERGFDVIHAHSPFVNGLPALAPARRHGVPVVYEVRAIWEDAAADHGTLRPGGLRYRLSRRIETRLLRRADAVVTICDGLRHELLRRGLDPARVFVVGNGVDLERFVPRPPDVELKRRFGLESGLVVGFVGSFYRYEGLPVLLDALAELRGRNVRVQGLLVGGGDHEAAVRAHARARNLDRSVRFTGAVPHAEVLRYYSLMDVLVYPRERLRLTELVTPLKPLEAMAQAKAVVGSDVGGIAELIQDGSTGLLFRAGEPSHLASALERLSRDPHLKQALGERARADVQARRAWPSIVPIYREVYRAARRAGGRAESGSGQVRERAR